MKVWVWVWHWWQSWVTGRLGDGKARGGLDSAGLAAGVAGAALGSLMKNPGQETVSSLYGPETTNSYSDQYSCTGVGKGN